MMKSSRMMIKTNRSPAGHRLPGAARAAFTSAAAAVTAAVLALGTLLAPQAALHAQAASAAPTAQNPVVIVLDPGHGGPLENSDNQGAIYAPYREKDLTLQLAKAIQAELSVYDNVQCFLTREDDSSLTLSERASIAAAHHADMLICLHFNASNRHDYYGSEVWTSAFDHNYAVGASFGETELAMLSGLGLYSKGVKTRIGQHGDYYGIIRHSDAAGIPCVLIEHCYLDSEEDRSLLSGKDFLSQLAHADAVSIAAWFHLKSSSYGIDFGQYVRPETADAPAGGIPQDTTAPDVCTLEQIGRSGSRVSFRLTAADTDSSYPLLYYSYTVDGKTSRLQTWPKGASSVTFTIQAPKGTQVFGTAHNSYELSTDSSVLTVK